MGRKSARENAFKLVYQMSFREMTELKSVISIFFAENLINKKDEQYINQITEGVFDNVGHINGLINNHSSNWENQRINRIDMAIMQVGIFEMLKMNDIPTGVSINEAVELAKKFGGDESPSFVNGVLGAIDKELKIEK